VVAAILRHERERQTAPAHGVGPRASQARGGGEVCDGIGDGDNSGRPCQHSPRRSPSLAAMSASWKQSLSAADRAHESLTVGRFVATSGEKQGRQRGELVAIVGEKPVAIDIRSPVTGAGVIPYRGWGGRTRRVGTVVARAARVGDACRVGIGLVPPPRQGASRVSGALDKDGRRGLRSTCRTTDV
jgi:hypothetical protein